MRALRACLAGLCVLVAASSALSGADYPYARTRPKKLKARPLSFNPPEPQRSELPNGLVVYSLPNHELPLFRATAYFKAGAIYDPPEKVGLAQLTGTVMRTGGTTTKTGDALDQQLEYLAADVETSIGRETGTATVSTLKKDMEVGLSTLADILRRPAFAQDKLELARRQMLEAIRRQNDDPSEVSRREFAELVYGKDNPWGRSPAAATAQAIQREDLVQFHRRFLHPNNLILAVSGDYEPQDLTRLLEKYFGDWPKVEISFPKVAPAPSEVTPGVYLVPRQGPQTVVRWGHLGMRRHSEDRPAVEVMNYILGYGGFSSRLMREVRTNRGLAYEVGGLVTEGTDRGLFVALALTKSESTFETAKVVRQVVEEMTTKPPTAEEVRLAKEALLNSYVFQFESPAALVSEYALNELLGYPRDYIRKYPERIRAVTPEDVLAAARKYLHPERMVLLVVGQPVGGEPLSTFGPVRELQLGEPPASGS